MPYEVFISYRREDGRLCDRIFELIRKLGYSPFRDETSLAAGQSWREQLLETLRQPGLTVVLLATKAAVGKPEEVVAEVQVARDAGRTVIPIEFERGATRHLLEEAGYEDPERVQYIDALDAAGNDIGDERLEDALRRALTYRVRKELERLRHLIKEWAEVHQRPLSFWETTWHRYFPLEDGRLQGSVALTAAGGSGKSFLIAHCVRHLLDDPTVYPILMDELMLREAASQLPELLGARSAEALNRHVEALAAQPPGGRKGWQPMRLVFVVDGLDHMVTPGDVRQKLLVDTLNLLANCAPVLIGCRQEAWDTWYAGRVSVRESPVAELGEPDVRQLLSRHSTLNQDSFNPLLQVPFYLDIVLSKADVWDSVPATKTALLHEIWSDAIGDGALAQPGLPEGIGRRWLVENLAACQLEQLAYDVSLAGLHKRPGFLPMYEKGLRDLEAAGLLVERFRRAGRVVRLRHDFLDDYSMARRLLDGPSKLEACQDLCRRCGKDCGSSVLAMLVQTVYDTGDDATRRELFEEFLFLLDHKRFGDEAMNRAWTVTHVLRTCFHLLFDLIVDALRGPKVPSLDPGDPTHVERRASSVGPPAGLTQEAASTLASAFMVLVAGGVELAAVAVPVLTRGLGEWKLRGRFLDALAKFRTAGALSAIVSFGKGQLQRRDDIDSLLYVARNLRHFQQKESSDLLREIFHDTTLRPMVRRVAAEGLKHLLPGQVTVPARDEEEVVDGLRIHGSDGRYTDWHVVQETAEYVRDGMARGDRFSSKVLVALTGALEHEQSYARRSVAQALALFPDATARDALLDEVLKPALPAEVRSACLEALEFQLRQLPDPRARQAFCYLLLRAAGAARHAGLDLVAEELTDLCLSPDKRLSDSWILTMQAAEVVPPSDAPWSGQYSVSPTEPEQDVLRELEDVGMQDVGPEKEAKYLIADIEALGKELRVHFAPTSWKLGKNFHNAVMRHPDRFLRAGRRWLEPVPLGDARLPGLAVVHGIVRTSDGQVLAAQRSAQLSYAPGHWSTSFEEQITDQDIREGEDAFVRAAQRGMLEEFGIEVDASRIHLISILLELDNLNLAPAVVIDAGQTLDQIRQRWLDQPRPSHAWEAQALNGVLVDASSPDRLADAAEASLEPLHPTSHARCLLLSRWLHWQTSR